MQAAAVLSVLVLGWQFLTAGRLLGGADVLTGHGAGAVALHVSTGLLLVAAALHGRATRTWWPAAVSAAVFALTFVQAAIGSAGDMTVHVPLALLLAVGIVWVTAWAFRPAG
ncbi:hypothetical protein D0Z06_06165 [Geodermatophilus marinus]|nr:hypothetical protein D0Z06_06165 [Geodermatophilus sp. LHW52908]